MLATLQEQLVLPSQTIVIASFIIFLAGLVRGFAGFGLTAFMMAGLALWIPPVSLIPLCIVLELVAGVVMLKGSLGRADAGMVLSLVISSTIGLPLGIATTLTISISQSKLVALLVIALLATLQLLNRSPAWLDTRIGLYSAGLVAGVITGIAGAGGMVIALYVLALSRPPVQIRASLVLYLFLSFLMAIGWFVLAGLMDETTLKRALGFTPMVITGVLAGTWLFKPALEPWYKPICLCLLLLLTAFGLWQL